MIINVTVNENIEMFRRAWTAVAVPKYSPDVDISIEECQQIWLEEFGCKMIYGKSGFGVAQFDSEADWTAFLLRWA